ncbi:ribonuclease H-like domain-containing protein [Tanacetum coccineum]
MFGNSSKNAKQTVRDSKKGRYKTSEEYHAVPPPYTGNFMPPKYDLILADEGEYVFSESVTSIPDAATSKAKTSVSKPKSVGEPLIEDWISNSEDENETEFKSKQRKPSFAKTEFVKSNEHVKTPRESVKKIENKKQAKYPRKNSQSPRVLSAVKGNKGNVVKASACWGNPQQDLKDKGMIDSGCSKHMTGNRSYLIDYEEIDGGFIAFGGNSKGGKITRKDFKLTDESHVLLKIPRKDNMYSVDLKNVVPQGGIENLIDLKVKVIRCNNGTEFKNRVMNQMKGIKREFSVARTPQQNGVAERKNRTLIEGARTMLADLKLPTIFWAEAVNTPCYVQNMVLVIKPHNKTPYELFLGTKPALNFLRPFGCSVTILNTIDHLGKFDGKSDEGFFIGYSTNSKAFIVFNSRTRIVEENLHVQFSENTPNITGSRPNWLFDIDALTKSMNYKPVVAGNQSNSSTSTKACDNAGKARMETMPGKEYILLPLSIQDPLFSSSSKDSPDVGFKPSGDKEKKDVEDPGNEDSEVPSTEEPRVNQEKDASVNSINTINTVSLTVNTASIEDNGVDENIDYGCDDDLYMLELEEIVCSDDDEDVGEEGNINNLDTHIPISPIPTTRINKDHLVEQIIRDIYSAPKTRKMTKSVTEQAMFNPSWIEAIQEELLQFKLQQVWTLVDLPNGKRAISTKWVYRNKKDERGIVIKNKSRLVAQGYTQEEGIDYDEVFAPVARFEAIRLFLAYASFKDFMVYQMDVKSAFLYEEIEEEVYVCQPPGFEDPDFPDRVYKVEKALYGFHQAPRAWYETLSTYLLDNLSLCLFLKTLLCNRWMSKNGEDVDEHMYRSMIGSLMYLTSSSTDIWLLMGFIKAMRDFKVFSESIDIYGGAEEMTWKWQVAMISIEESKSSTRRLVESMDGRCKEKQEEGMIGNTGNREIGKAKLENKRKRRSNALVTVDGESIDWTIIKR